MSNHKAEILAPVGNWEMCLAAVHNGADAVYVGMPNFNARGRAKTFELEELREIIEYCHRYGVKVFLAFNVLIFERELAEALPLLIDVLSLGPDAFIVQDIGLARLIHQLAPDQVLHASTQMTITSYEAIEATKDLQLKRYVLGREVSIDEMARIREKTEKELEVFVHGALCVSYSGQCLTSESFGGRSANRGQCAQSCRLQYDLIVDGELRDLGERRYLVSPKDLCAIDDVDRLQELGINSFKIEGRLKSPEYVASAVQSYRARVLGEQLTDDERDELKVVYSRDFFNGWMDGVNHQRLVDGRYSGHHGLLLGEVVGCSEKTALVQSRREIKPGDGVVFADFTSGVELGGHVYTAERIRSRASNQSNYRLGFANDFELEQIAPGMQVFLNSSPSIAAKWRRSFTDKALSRKVPLTGTVSGELGTQLRLELQTENGSVVAVNSEALLQPAENAPLTPETLRAELGALGGTQFVLGELQVKIPPAAFIHQRELKRMRRAACEKLDERQKVRPVLQTRSVEEIQSWLSKRRVGTVAGGTAGLNVLIRDSDQLEALEGLPLATVYLDYEFGRDYGPSLERVRAMGFQAGIATTRILKPGETGHLGYIKRLAPDSVLVRNLGAWQFLHTSGIPLVGDFSLNVANSLTAEWLMEKGFARLVPSYDLNRDQLFDLLDRFTPSAFEITVHQYMPSFHMEHCVFAAFLSNGTSYRDCGRPCERHTVELRDRTGACHPLKADAECRNTMFTGTAQSAAKLVPELLKRGVTSFRLEALSESSDELRTKVSAYLSLLSGDAAAQRVISQLGLVEKYGVTEGQLLNLRIYEDRKKEDRV